METPTSFEKLTKAQLMDYMVEQGHSPPPNLKLKKDFIEECIRISSPAPPSRAPASSGLQSPGGRGRIIIGAGGTPGGGRVPMGGALPSRSPSPPPARGRPSAASRRKSAHAPRSPSPAPRSPSPDIWTRPSSGRKSLPERTTKRSPDLLRASGVPLAARTSRGLRAAATPRSLAALAAGVALLAVALSGYLWPSFCRPGESLGSARCIPCPAQGTCYDGKLTCFLGWEREGNQCVDDGEVKQLTRLLTTEIRSYVCGELGKVRCGAAWGGTEFVPLTSLGKHLSNRGWVSTLSPRKGNPEERFQLAVDGALNELAFQGITRWGGQTATSVRCDPELAEDFRPAMCKAKIWAVENATELALFLAGAAITLVAACWAGGRRRRGLKVEELAAQAKAMLAEAAERAEAGGRGAADVPSSHIRDAIVSPQARRRDPGLWAAAEKLVEGDSRVDVYPKKVKGEELRMWEWTAR